MPAYTVATRSPASVSNSCTGITSENKGCKAMSMHTVAEKWDCRRKRRDNGEIRRLSHFSATVWTGLN